MSYELPAASKLTAHIFAVDGRLMRTLAAGEEFAAGPHTLHWDGRGRAHERLPSGLYFVAVRAGAEFDTRKILLTH
jgi:flagellar hook assembly protein FlgD